MKKKSLILIALLAFIINFNVVSAASSFSSKTISACGFDYMPEKLPNFTSGLYNIVKLLVPIILIVMGMIDFTRAIMASDENKMKDSQKRFINRLIAGVIIFLIMAVVQFVFKNIDTTKDYKNGFTNCMNCILNGNIGACGKGTKGEELKSCKDYGNDSCTGVVDDYGNECQLNESGKCVIKEYTCSDYNATNCPSKTPNNVYSCEVRNGQCLSTCNGLGVQDCNKMSSSCTWNGSVCINK